MSWWQSLPWSEAAGWACVAFVTVLAVLGTRPRKRKENIRVPRETLWERTNRYHGERNANL